MADRVPPDQGATISETGEYVYPEDVKKKAKSWFDRARTVADTRNYDYAIECFRNGLQLWPEAIEEGYIPLREVAIKRQGAGGKKPGLRDTLSLSTTAKDKKQNLLNAIVLLAKDPLNVSYMEALAKNAIELGYVKVLRWIGPTLFEALRADKKITPERLLNLRDWYEAAADLLSDDAQAIEFLEKALHVAVVAEAFGARSLDDSRKKKDLAAKVTMRKGNYEKAKSFRDSLQDAGKAKALMESERVTKTDEQFEVVLKAAREAYEAAPTVGQKLFSLVDLMASREQDALENEAIALLNKEFERSGEFRFRSRAYDIKLKQARRALAARVQKAQAATDEATKATLAKEAQDYAQKLLVFEVKMWGERVDAYPTDMTVRYQYADALFRSGNYEEAIPNFQVAQNDPKNRVRSLLKTGQCFFNTKFFPEAADSFKQAFDALEVQTDETAKDVMYSLARCYEEMGNAKEALAFYSRVAQLDFGYKDVRARITKLRQAV